MAIGLAKALHRADGVGDIHDAEFQSAIHERTHEFDGAPDLSTEEQVRLLRGLRSQVAQAEHISDADKYRVSQRQPGLVTRLDQEIGRLETGKDEHGRPLRPEQKNTGANIAAIQRLGSMLDRIQPAKKDYLDIYARHTGASYHDAEGQWNRIMGQERGGRGSVGISLTDDWKERLAVAGMTTQQQADLGQSARSRDAIAIMEGRRQQALSQRESRNTIREGHRSRFVKPQNAKLQCVGLNACGQFGHEVQDCPNQDLTKQRLALRHETVHYERMRQAAAIEQQLATASDEDLVSYAPDDDGVPDAEVLHTGAEARRDLETQRDHLLGDGAHEPIAIATAETKLRHLAAQEQKINQQIAERNPQVSSAVKELAYNSETGTMAVTTHPYRRKTTGELTPERTFLYRVAPEEYHRIISSKSVGAALNGSVWRKGKRGTNEGYKYENRADAEAALLQQRCPTCGRWASMNSSHTCPVPGSPEQRDDMRYRAEQAHYRSKKREAEANDEDPPEPPSRVALLYGKRRVRIGGGQEVNMPDSGSVDEKLNKGNIAQTSMMLHTPSGTVQGTATVWTDPDGTRLISPLQAAGGVGLRCSCGKFSTDGSCDHIKQAMGLAKQRYHGKTVNTPDLVPGVSIAEFTSPVAFDAPEGELSRLSYAEIMNQRRAAERGEVRGLRQQRDAGQSMSQPTMVPPRDADGQEIAWPTQWQRAGVDEQVSDSVTGGTDTRQGAARGYAVDLNALADVKQRMRQSLFSRSRVHWSVSAEDGGLRISVPRSRRRSGLVPYEEQQKLAELLNVPARQIGHDGVYIPADTSWRSEYLDRCYGDSPRTRAARYTLV